LGKSNKLAELTTTPVSPSSNGAATLWTFIHEMVNYASASVTLKSGGVTEPWVGVSYTAR